MDYLTRDGAEELARRIERYWHDQGFTAVRVWVEPFGDGKHRLHAVRSNLMSGLPPTGYAEAA